MSGHIVGLVEGEHYSAIPEIGELFSKANTAFDRLESDPDPQVRAKTAWAVRTVGAGAIGPLTGALRDDRPEVRVSAARALGDMEIGFTTKLQLRRTSLFDSDPNVRAEAKTSLQ